MNSAIGAAEGSVRRWARRYLLVFAAYLVVTVILIGPILANRGGLAGIFAFLGLAIVVEAAFRLKIIQAVYALTSQTAIRPAQIAAVIGAVGAILAIAGGAARAFGSEDIAQIPANIAYGCDGIWFLLVGLQLRGMNLVPTNIGKRGVVAGVAALLANVLFVLPGRPFPFVGELLSFVQFWFLYGLSHVARRA